MPCQLQPRTLSIAHEGHQGIVRTKQLLREKVWWPGIDRAVEALIRSCIPCQAVAPSPPPEPLRPSEMPTAPWQSIHIDLCGPFPTGESILVCIDACSRWPEVEILQSTSSEAVIRHLRRIFATHGLPQKVTSDNGSNLVSRAVEEYFSTNGISHRKVTPYWPQANGTVERFNRTIGKAIRTAHVEGKNWKQEIYTFLLNYRATRHGMTGFSPAKIMFGRDLRTKVPQLDASPQADALCTAQTNDGRNKQKMKVYADKRNHAAPSQVQEGDIVLLKQAKENKLSTAFDPEPYQVLERRGASVLLRRGAEHPIMRNVSLTHKIDGNRLIQDNQQEEDNLFYEAHGAEQEELPPEEPGAEAPEEANAEEPEAEALGPRPVRARNRPAHLQDYVLTA